MLACSSNESLSPSGSRKKSLLTASVEADGLIEAVSELLETEKRPMKGALFPSGTMSAMLSLNICDTVQSGGTVCLIVERPNDRETISATRRLESARSRLLAPFGLK